MTTTPAPAPSSMDRFFAGLRTSPVVRSPHGTIGGVCAGIAEHLDVSTRVVRIAAVIGLLTGIGVPLYLFAWLLLPDRTGRVHLERALRAGGASSIVLLIVTALVLLPEHDHHGSSLVWLALVAAGAVVLARRHRHDTV